MKVLIVLTGLHIKFQADEAIKHITTRVKWGDLMLRHSMNTNSFTEPLGFKPLLPHVQAAWMNTIAG